MGAPEFRGMLAISGTSVGYPYDVVCTTDYAATRAAERGWRGGGAEGATTAWELGMHDAGVVDMTSVLIYGCCHHHREAVGEKWDASTAFALQEHTDKQGAGYPADFAVFVAMALNDLARHQHDQQEHGLARHQQEHRRQSIPQSLSSCSRGVGSQLALHIFKSTLARQRNICSLVPSSFFTLVLVGQLI